MKNNKKLTPEEEKEVEEYTQKNREALHFAIDKLLIEYLELAEIPEEKRTKGEAKKMEETQKAFFKEIDEKAKEAKLKGKGRLILGGHLADQMLQKGNTKASDLFDVLEEETKIQLHKAKIELSEIIEGVTLTPLQNEIVLTLSKLRYEKFQSIIPIERLPNIKLDKSVAFGNGTKKEDEEIAPVVIITPYEIARELKGGAKPSGRDVENTLKALKELGETKYLMRETKRYTQKNGAWIQREVRGYRSLIIVDEEIVQTGVGEETKTERRALAITLNPIFIRDIATKYISYPNDIVKRTIEAYSSQRVPNLVYRLRDYLARAQSSGWYEHTISLEKLFEIIAPKQRANSRVDRIKKNMEKGLEACKEIGLLEQYKYTTGVGGHTQIVFYLHKKWI